MRGRVFGAMTAAACAAMPLGVLVAGPLLVRPELRWMLLAVGGCSLIALLSTLPHPGAARERCGARLCQRDLPCTCANFLNFKGTGMTTDGVA